MAAIELRPLKDGRHHIVGYPFENNPREWGESAVCVMPAPGRPGKVQYVHRLQGQRIWELIVPSEPDCVPPWRAPSVGWPDTRKRRIFRFRFDGKRFYFTYFPVEKLWIVDHRIYKDDPGMAVTEVLDA